MLVQLTQNQARVIGVLLEKEITTPEQYPLSLNALMLGCNQKSSREPVMHLSENDVQNILDELAHKNLLFEHRSSGSRVVKYKHRFCNTEFSSLKFNPQQLAVICVLLLRGPQTPGELRTRTNRLAEFSDVNEVETTLNELTDFNGETLVVKLNREPGKRDARYAHLFSGQVAQQEPSTSSSTPSTPNQTEHLQPAAGASELTTALERIDALELQVNTLTKRLSEMQETLDILSS